MSVPAHAASFWRSFVRLQIDDPTPRFFEAFHFGDNEPSANALADLVLAGRKRATASLVWSYEAESAPFPAIGGLSIVTDGSNEPRCIIETRQIDVVAFDDVTEEFAAIEGEGDGSLRYWKEAHWACFGRECERIGRVPDPRMQVVCERSALCFEPDAGLPPELAARATCRAIHAERSASSRGPAEAGPRVP